MNEYDIFELCRTIFVKCVYSAYLTVTPSWRHTNESVYNSNLILICNGCGIFTSDNERRTVHPGDIVFFPAGVRRTMRSDGGMLTFRSINFRYTFISDEMNEWHMNNGNLPFDFVRHISDKSLLTRIEQLFIQIQKYYFTQQLDSEFHMRHYATELIALLLAGGGSNITFSEQNMVDDTIRYMSAHFNEKINLDTLAKVSGKGVSYYGKIFKKITGKTPIKYLLDMRIDYAKGLILNGMSVTEACGLCGFDSLHYFSRAFKQKEKISPREYVSIHKREQYKQP